MASINYAARQISVKIVYYGPGLSGKTTNLQVIHKKTPQDHRSDMVSLATETDRTLFFDFLPLDLGKIKGFATKFQLYTVPGQVYYNATRKLVLRGVDGVVFVADSGADKIQENLESFQNLEDNLAEYGYQRESIPIIIQYNKRDLPNALSIDELNRHINKYNLPYGEGIAYKGVGVFDTLKQIGKIVIDYLNKKYSRSGPSRGPAPAAAPELQAPPPQPAPQQQFAPPPPPQYAPGQTAQFAGYQQPAQQAAPPPSFEPAAPSFEMAPPPQAQSFDPYAQQASPWAAPPAPVADPFAVTPGAPPPAPSFEMAPQPPPQPPPTPFESSAFEMAPLPDVLSFETVAPHSEAVPPPYVPGQTAQFAGYQQPAQPFAPPPAPGGPAQSFNYDDMFMSEPPPAPPAKGIPLAGNQGGYGQSPFDLEMAQTPPTPSHMNAPQQGQGGFGAMDFTPQQPAGQGFAQTQFTDSAPTGDKSELDIEIEKYQREIEEKQKKMRSGTGAFPSIAARSDVHEMQPYPGAADHSNHFKSPLEPDTAAVPTPHHYQQQQAQVQPPLQQYAPPQQQYTPPQQQYAPPPQQQYTPQPIQQHHSSFYEFEAELEGSGGGQDGDMGEYRSNDSAMFFTSVDRSGAKPKKPTKPPVNPKLKAQQQQQQQQQKGFMSNLFKKPGQ
jgi:hypothetical protein